MSDIKMKLPVGIESFGEIRTEGFYYVDKTGLIRDLLCSWGKVNLFTRPRCFGKSLNMSMLKAFFEIGCRKELFDGLEIAGETELCRKYMGKFPVISISLKGVEANTFEKARSLLIKVINEEARSMQYLLESDKLTRNDKEVFSLLLKKDMDDETLCCSLREMSEFLQKHYGRKAIVLIDEYDVPLAKANEHNYYEPMVFLVRNIFEQVLKTNDSLYFAVLTGCLRVAKESIFIGLNNLNVLSVRDVEFDEYFGFTDQEVTSLLNYYGLSGTYSLVKDWYDGYRFGNANVYCPWNVICFCKKRRVNRTLLPGNYWSNTSGNDVIRHFLRKAKPVTKREIEKLIAGECVLKEIHQELTYKNLYQSVEHIWSVLFTTGYLTQRGESADGKSLWLAIPNHEIRDLFISQISEWFQETARQDGEVLEAFCEAFQNGDAAEAERCFNAYLNKSISIRDTAVKNDMKENFYHGILLGLLGFKGTWDICSNRESGDGYSDILIEIADMRIGIVIELKYPMNGNLELGCEEAMNQIESKRYAVRLSDDGMKTILKYGIACYKKRCRVVLEKEEL